MTRGTKTFLMAIGSAVAAWVVGLYLVGSATIRHFTAGGTVDMTDASKIARALGDSTFNATMSWGSVTLTGTHWPFTFPILLGLAAFVLVFVLRGRRPSQD
ncbi:hypothetical protein [Lysobacter sp. Root604]|uniref:hypothetical protein n=1 Tax=Lysobacter sp. Root604 TaxID=1736568 RepID=UPI0006F8BF00|nr:hypothetical protein [Lysobacter sp. Root604]KRA15340.1 hypothetical protein ASD69_17855 [Lysobacter sp. Root604]